MNKLKIILLINFETQRNITLLTYRFKNYERKISQGPADELNRLKMITT